MTALARHPRTGLPDFVIIGTMQAGTTTLHRLLDEHPDVGMSRMKETDYIIESAQFELAVKWYPAQFNLNVAAFHDLSSLPVSRWRV